jgi:large subunit ribosomal protein L24
MKIKKGDKVKVLTGRDKGREGTVVKAFPKLSQVIVEGLNQVKRHQRARRQGEKGQIVTISAPLNVSNVRKLG